MLIAIDPGKNLCGVAVFDASGELTEAYVMRGQAWDSARVVESGGGDVLVFERPQVYRTGIAPGDPNDLVDVALAAGAWAREAARLGYEVRSRRPREWKGQLDKPICRRKAKAVMSAAELGRVERVALTNGGEDMWDAIALGLVELGRLKLRAR